MVLQLLKANKRLNKMMIILLDDCNFGIKTLDQAMMILELAAFLSQDTLSPQAKVCSEISFPPVFCQHIFQPLA